MPSTDQQIWEAFSAQKEDPHAQYAITVQLQLRDLIVILDKCAASQGKGEAKLPSTREYGIQDAFTIVEDADWRRLIVKDAHDALMAYFSTNFVNFYEEELVRNNMVEDTEFEPYDISRGKPDPQDLAKADRELDGN